MLFENYPDLVTVAQLQKMLSVGRSMAYTLIESRIIPSVRIGNTYRIIKKDVISYINGNSAVA